MKNKNQLSVRLNGTHVGILEQTANGKMIFTYDPSAKQSISIGMPVQNAAYDEVRTEAYFGGLLPESDAVKSIIGKYYGISPNNHFALLKAIGYDCAGAISCHEMDDTTSSKRLFPLTAEIIGDDELYQHIKELPKKPLFMNFDGLRLSLAGVQDKAAVCVIDNQIGLPKNGCPTTHILKPASSHFDGMVENEYFILKIAKQIGLPIPNIELRRIKDITFLLIERYDRQIKDNHVLRIHQEDFCQALGMLSTKKYQNEGGPGFKDCFDLLKETAQPAIDRNVLASALVFNYLICNMDAHGKNFSLLHQHSNNIRLAPFYDMVCTSVYTHLSTKMAMKIGGKYEANRLLPQHWEQLCHQINYGYPAMKEIILKQSELILQAAQLEKKSLRIAAHYHSIIDKIIKVIETNIVNTIKHFTHTLK